MNKIKTIAKYELLRYFASPLAYVYLIAFLLLNGSFAIYFGSFFDRGQADLSPMFAYHPWLYLLFIPGISMRLWAEEFRNRTIIQIVTMPVSIPALVLGKFLAALAFCAIALILTFPFWITVNILGDPDNGVIALSYFGSLILAACMLAISQAMSALTKNQVIALVLSVVANFVFFLSGVEFILAFVRLFAPVAIVDTVASFSFLTHFNIIIQGLLELRDIAFFSSIVALFLFITVIVISFKTSGTSSLLKSNDRKLYILAFVGLLLGFVGLNLMANNFMRRPQFDFTYNHKFELTKTSKDILKTLKEPVTANLYYSKILEQRNPSFRLMFDDIRLKLEEFKKASEGKFSYRIFDPEFLTPEEDMAYALELQPIPVIDLSQNAFFGISFNDTVDNQTAIPYISLERRNFIEQDFISKIYNLGREKKTVGILSSLPIFDTGMTDSYITPRWEFLNQIEEFYKIKKIEKPEDFADIDTLMVIHPVGLAPEMISAVKEFADKGKNALLLLDVAAEAPRIYMPVNRRLVPSDTEELGRIFGFKIHNGAVIGDLENSIMVDVTKNYKKNPMFTQDVIQFILKRENFHPELPEVKYLQNILFASASDIKPDSPDVLFYPSIQTGYNSAYFAAEVVYDNVSPELLLKGFKADNTPKTVAARILGKKQKWQAIVVADSDFAYDTFWSTTVNIMETNYVVPLFDNVNFILNALEILSGAPYLGEIRKSSTEERPFKDIEKIRKAAGQEFKVKESGIFDRINQTKAALQEIVSKRSFEERETFTADELAVIAKLRKHLEDFRKDLSRIRKDQKTAIDKIDTAVKFVNIYAVPLLLLAALFFISRSKNKKAGAQTGFRLNGQAAVILSSCLLLFAAGLLSNHLLNRSKSFESQGEFVFPQLGEEINGIDRIILKTNKQELVFAKDKIWSLEGRKDIPVYQERIRQFLTTLIQAVYFDRKSGKLDHLAKFNLEPQENPDSRAILVELKNKEDKTVASFYIGKYDIDIGRGGKAAYIRFADSYQVWLAEMDFIDLSLNWQNWTYSTVWNLRFGRLQSGDADTDKAAGLVKVLLNAHFIGFEKELKNPAPAFTVPLSVENQNAVRLEFFTQGGRFFVRYAFEKINNENLQFFADSIKDGYLEISKETMEKIKNAYAPHN